ncbi:uncharacterized protein LOC113851199 [Abrus precatorius]|uniref:Uncharacterized protein LOC113851199 n=1 Tax=Abrus precatorius TaxID=3816 RepID=A0A8B8K241_ABRPR|nr:uncharacterized protein LOC113851199 [Abrus precatorius]
MEGIGTLLIFFVYLKLSSIEIEEVLENFQVRSEEEGLLGSWHAGTVIHCGKLKRYIRYTNILENNRLNYLVDVVNVPKALDGEIESSYCYKRSFIRPMPPLVDFGRLDLKFGLCVDVIQREAWWEGVIFDHCDGMETRSVFFPDLGDELQIEIHQLRITQDWDEVTGEWEQRGNWVLLELIEECERESLVAISAKQIWYDVQGKEEFCMIGDWTYNVKYLWKNLVREVVNDYLKLTVKDAISVLNLPGSSQELNSDEAMANVDFNMTLTDEEIVVQKEPAPPNSGASCFGRKRKPRSPTHLRSTYWTPLEFSEVELCPDAVRQYALGSSRTSRKLWKERLQKHLAYLGWEIEWSNRFNIKRYRYKLPDELGQKVYLSLVEVCKSMLEDPNKNNSLQSQKSRMHLTIDSHLSNVVPNPSQKNQDLNILPPDDVKPEFYPQAIVEYYHAHQSNKNKADKKKWILKAKNHLLAEGWSFDYPPPTNKKRGIRYMSPQNKRFTTLHAACRFCIEEGIPEWAISDMQPSNVSSTNEENVDQVWSGELSHRVSQFLPKDPELHAMDGAAANRSTSNRKRKYLRNSESNLPNCQSNGLPLRMLRSNKRVQNMSAPCSSQHKPLNVMSWLIDCNMVLPRSKVYYKAKGRQRTIRTMAVGKITRDGIKCNCCMKIYSLVGFEHHASGISTCRPSSSIFLEDGRSLLHCQMQIMQDHKTSQTSEKPFSELCQGDNDYICSVCHNGGELILCDQCPSSFHKMCLGLKDVPDGDWFCPSCCCGICGQNKIHKDEDEHFLTCAQCEHKYHVRCLNNGAADISRYWKTWFCGKDCEKIYEGLHKLLGAPVSVGVDNLTWTLVKFINSESCDLGGTEHDLAAESFSKLNLALSLMHECFEPLKEPFSSKDLMEDVMLSSWSELNRLNFQGFYTVLLERNEELISVAIIRVYGRKVAEVPLVGTRLQYRRHGMCRILMNELEKKLMQLGVERLVLPAIPSVLETCTRSFGFAKMTSFERSRFLDYTFLDFQGTIMCQKLLMKIQSPDSVCLIDSQQKCVVFSGSCSAYPDKSSQMSEVYQEEEINKGGMLDQQMGSGHHVYGAIDPITMEEQPSPRDQQCQNGTSSQYSLVNQAGNRYNGLYKYYNRRKVRKTCEGFRMSLLEGSKLVSTGKMINSSSVFVYKGRIVA